MAQIRRRVISGKMAVPADARATISYCPGEDGFWLEDMQWSWWLLKIWPEAHLRRHTRNGALYLTPFQDLNATTVYHCARWLAEEREAEATEIADAIRADCKLNHHRVPSAALGTARAYLMLEELCALVNGSHGEAQGKVAIYLLATRRR